MVLVTLQGGYGAVPAVPEQDELDAVETQQFLAQLGRGIRDAILAAQEFHLLRVGQFGCQAVHVQRPGVDMRVDAEVRRSAEQEGFGLFPGLAGLQELGADGVQFALAQFSGTFFRGGGKQFIQLTAFLGEVAVGGVDHAGDILCRDGLHRFLGVAQAAGFPAVSLAGCGRHAEGGQRKKDKELFHISLFFN